MSQDFDYFIADLGFNKNVSKDAPEERATASFRKDQFDTQTTVGDQSLTGWWTRGQLSFHKGGGVLYYEVQAGETVLDRFDSAKGVDPFTPGQVTIGRALEELDTGGVGFEDVVKVSNYIVGDRLCARADDGNAYEVTVGSPLSSQTITAITTTGGGDVNAIAAARFALYLAIGENIEVWRPGDVTSTVLWTGTLPDDIKAMWYAKQRLWIVDGFGNWYVLDTDGGTFNDTDDARFTIKDYGWLVTSGEDWSLVESSSSVYIGIFNEVYGVTVDVDADTLLPTLGAPTLMIELPENERVHCLGYTLGTIAIGTDSGMRFAIQDGSGGLAYGPRLGLASFAGAQRMAARSTRISTMGEYFDEIGLYSYDLGQTVDVLQPAHVLEIYSEGDGLDRTGAINTLQGTVAWSSGRQMLYRTSDTDYSASASIKTGFHRFGTLDPKWFRSVLVRAGGSGGSIGVYRRDPNGATYTETLLGTVTYPETEADLDLGPDEPAERVALKFVLNADEDDPTLAPILLGYQLKALPLPKRQRMVRIPLMLYNYEVDGRTATRRGGPGQAWSRLAALEALEESNAVVTFEDTETGESGNAYIEALEVRRTTPTSRTGDGFGGLLYVTLRKL